MYAFESFLTKFELLILHFKTWCVFSSYIQKSIFLPTGMFDSSLIKLVTKEFPKFDIQAWSC